MLLVGKPSLRFPLGLFSFSTYDLESSALLDKKEPRITTPNDSNDIVISDRFETIRDDYKAPRYPLVLCHGLSGFDKVVLLPSLKFLSAAGTRRPELSGFSIDYWNGIKEALQDIGCTVLTGKVPPFGTIRERAEKLDSFIEEEAASLLKATHPGADSKPIKVNLIAHSMGGLDCRYLITKLQQSNYEVMSLTTIATPHYGSAMADWCLKYASKALLPRSISELSINSMKTFNQEVLDKNNVKYFSYGARFCPNLSYVFFPSWKIIFDIEGDNDGMVSVSSSKWGKYLGTLDNVDHLDLINWRNEARVAINLLMFKKGSKFNAVALYLEIADQLAREGL
ncbi:Lipase 2 [Komagataella phaffii CBS 7435]|uniref:Protein with lipolytic activity towards triacylglycerols and diacylglycerols when expressed in E. co n=2 Tax=Komagataella phaffii TaxID=460519 RepID=C4R1S8_KOMPG|nr:Protein with lipolytic activity towards triacylglycerols and diacylglycerols when expressed in E. co [Komagataella phaffii GS115]AOA61903.1 GQ67_00868T0 [Komagataella phaffii]CAH2448009.1 Lipase 2 [Komagataella phaffii CBS 7435]AOA67016.1 GQ68_00521T0 [Komagataella phaffii GS115]CAY69452.1 Protein with lipolytic activity towards triacylglycerols and diacylglycerols when expressed in E. co [Komagataella phaffii GS115]CCA38164.1 Lipase 2 [Komagataella phaffii CBS 7435]